ncbi:MAG: helix-turn-helix transcriptional regulator [Vicinamibacterales bacterium]
MDDGSPRRWTFLTNHGHVLVCLARSPELRLREVAERVGVTERAVQRIVADLEEAGFLTRHRSGRQNEYEIDVDRPMRHPVEADRTVGAFLRLLEDGEAAVPAPKPRPRPR